MTVQILKMFIYLSPPTFSAMPFPKSQAFSIPGTKPQENVILDMNLNLLYLITVSIQLIVKSL